MRLVLCLSLAALAAALVYACGETEETTQSESPGATTPAASGSATPTTSPGATATASPTAASDTPTPTPAGVVSLSTYEDTDHGFSLKYPTGWTVTDLPVTADQADLDVIQRTDFVAKDGLPHIRLFVGANPADLSLIDWLEERNPIFLDTPPEEVTIDGVGGLYQPLSLGLPMPQAYLKVGSIVVSIAGLTGDDYMLAASHLDFD